MAELAGKKEKSLGSRRIAETENIVVAPNEPGATQQVGIGGLGASTSDRAWILLPVLV